MDAPPLSSLSLTHVYYDESDPLSHLCAYLALVPQCLVIAYAVLAVSTREVEVLIMFAGQMACEATNWLLKRWIREDRPTQMLGKGYGMPSSHAQFVAFFSCSVTLFLLLRHRPYAPVGSPSSSSSSSRPPQSTSTSYTFPPLWQRVSVSAGAVVGAAAVAGSRIYLNYHTPRQVEVGVVAGVACALGWFLVTSVARSRGLVDSLLELPLARTLRLRDLVVNEDPSDAGWERWELRRSDRRRLAEKQKRASDKME